MESVLFFSWSLTWDLLLPSLFLPQFVRCHPSLTATSSFVGVVSHLSLDLTDSFWSRNVLCPGHMRPQSILCLSLDMRGREDHTMMAGSVSEGRQSPRILLLFMPCQRAQGQSQSYKATAHPRLPQPLCSWEMRVMPSYSKVEMDHTAWLAGPHFDRWAD